VYERHGHGDLAREQARQVVERTARQRTAPDLHDDRLCELSVHER
jgi:hypothetical protein